MVTKNGFDILHRTHQPGISERRAAWFIKWIRQVPNSERIDITTFEEGLKRVMYVARETEYERSSLGAFLSFPLLTS